MTEQGTLLGPVTTINLGVVLNLPVVVVREPRHRCPTCLLRRVLYRITVGPAARTTAQCAACWGIR